MTKCRTCQDPKEIEGRKMMSRRYLPREKKKVKENTSQRPRFGSVMKKDNAQERIT